MNKDEFIKICRESGYARKAVAEEYCKGKDAFTEDDFLEVWRINQRKLDVKNGALDDRMRHLLDNKTTKRYKRKDDV